MSNTLFAFQVAKPTDVVAETTTVFYDPHSQRTIWPGDTRPFATTCSHVPTGYQSCSADDGACEVGGNPDTFAGYACDM